MAIVRSDPFRDLFALQDQLFRTFGSAYRNRREQGRRAAGAAAEAGGDQAAPDQGLGLPAGNPVHPRKQALKRNDKSEIHREAAKIAKVFGVGAGPPRWWPGSNNPKNLRGL